MYGYTYTKRKSGKQYFYYRCNNHLTIGPEACPGLTVPGDALEGFVVDTLKELSEDQQFLSDKEKMLETLKKEASKHSKTELGDHKALQKTQHDLESRIDTLLEKLETGVIDDKTFVRRHDQLKLQLEDNQIAQLEAQQSCSRDEHAVAALNASFEQIASFERNWDVLDDKGKAALLSTVVKRISVTEDKMKMEVYFDSVAEVSRRGRGS